MAEDERDLEAVRGAEHARQVGAEQRRLLVPVEAIDEDARRAAARIAAAGSSAPVAFHILARYSAVALYAFSSTKRGRIQKRRVISSGRRT